MRQDRFQPSGPVGDAPAKGGSPSVVPPTQWVVRLLNGQTLAWLMALVSLLTAFATYVGSAATKDANSAQAALHAREFEASVEQRFMSLNSRADALDRDPESRWVANASKIESVVSALNARIDEVNRRLDQRSEARTAEINEVKQAASNLALKVCVLSGLKVSQCK